MKIAATLVFMLGCLLVITGIAWAIAEFTIWVSEKSWYLKIQSRAQKAGWVLQIVFWVTVGVLMLVVLFAGAYQFLEGWF